MATLVAQEDFAGGQLRVYSHSIDFGAVVAEDTADVDVSITGITSSDKVLFATPQGNPGDRLCISGAVCATDKVTVTASNSGDDNSANVDAFTILLGVLKLS